MLIYCMIIMIFTDCISHREVGNDDKYLNAWKLMMDMEHKALQYVYWV